MIISNFDVERMNNASMQNWAADEIPQVPFAYESGFRALEVGQFFRVPREKNLKQDDLWRLCYMVSGMSGRRFRLRTEIGLDGRPVYAIWRDI